MRFWMIVAALLLFTVPALAQQNGGLNFGRITCTQPLPCPGDENAALSSSSLVAQGNACFTQSFGYTNQAGFFDELAGLDMNNCLTPIPGSVPKGLGTQLIPACCIVKLPAGTCAFRCELNTAS